MRFSRKHSAGCRECAGTALASTCREAPSWEKSWLMCMNQLQNFSGSTSNRIAARGIYTARGIWAFCQAGLSRLSFSGWGVTSCGDNLLGGRRKYLAPLPCLILSHKGPASAGPQLAKLLLRHITWEEAATRKSCHPSTSSWSKARAQPTTGLAGPAERHRWWKGSLQTKDLWHKRFLSAGGEQSQMSFLCHNLRISKTWRHLSWCILSMFTYGIL